MIKPVRLLVMLLLALPAARAGDPPADRRIEMEARASYNLRVLLQDRVEVRVRDGVAVLSGQLPDGDWKTIAGDTVGSLPGVIAVENQIGIDPAGAVRSDAAIVRKVVTMLHMQAGVVPGDFRISANGGIVLLRGSARSETQRVQLNNWVCGVDWTKGVRNELKVAPPAGASGGNRDLMDDASITAQVRFTLRAHRDTAKLDTGVATDGGVVTLTATRASAAQKARAGQLASGGRGVKSVVNRISLL